MSEFYDRRATLRVIEQDINVSEAGGLSVADASPVARVFPSLLSDGSPGFRITFNILKNIEGTPNPASIYIYNLGPDSRAAFEKLNSRVILEAGYGDDQQVIFQGNISRTRTEKKGADYITHIEAADGLVAFEGARVNQSFGQPTSLSDVVKTLTDSFSSANIGTEDLSAVPSKTYQSGIVLSGKSADLLSEVLQSEGLEFSIQDEQIIILPAGSERGVEAFVLGVETGMVGIPQVGDQSITVSSLMNPRLKPYNQIVINSKFVNGIYRIIRVEHVGDTFEGEFLTKLETDRAQADATSG